MQKKNNIRGIFPKQSTLRTWQYQISNLHIDMDKIASNEK